MNWGTAELEYSKLLVAVRADRSYEFAQSRFVEALKVKPDFVEALGRWGICVYHRQIKSDWAAAHRKGMMISAAHAIHRSLDNSVENFDFAHFHYYLGLVFLDFSRLHKQFPKIKGEVYPIPEPYKDFSGSQLHELELAQIYEKSEHHFRESLKHSPRVVTYNELTQLLLEKISFLQENKANDQDQMNLYLEIAKLINASLELK